MKSNNISYVWVFKGYIGRLRKTLKDFKINQQFMLPGKYTVDPNLRFIYRSDKETAEIMNRFFFKNNYKLRKPSKLEHTIKRLLVGRYLLVKDSTANSDYGFKGNIYLLSNSDQLDRDCKILNFKSCEVLSIYVNRCDLEKKISDYNRYSSYFNIPKIKNFNLEKQISIEELIESKPSDKWSSDDFSYVRQYILKSYKDYYEKSIDSTSSLNCIRPNFFLDELLSDNSLRDLSQFIGNYLDETICSSFPLTYQHGDLWLSNLMLTEDKDIYIIDWEHSGEYIFFYDIFWWIHYRMMYDNSYETMEKYLSGQYDSYMRAIFQSVGFTYNTKLRSDYYLVFLLEILYRRILKKSVNLSEEFKNRLKDIIVRVKMGAEQYDER